MHAQVGLAVTFDVFAADEDTVGCDRLFRDAGEDDLAVLRAREGARQADTDGAESEPHAFFRFFAVLSMADLSLATISSISASETINGGASTMVSRMARETRPSLKQ